MREGITVEALDKEIEKAQKKPMSWENLCRFTELCRAKKYLMRNMPGLTEMECQQWVDKMYPKARWTVDQTTSVMESRGYTCDKWEFWAVMNSLYSDYGKTMAKYGADKPEVWADLAYDWIHDEDARPNKAGVYYHGIVR